MKTRDAVKIAVECMEKEMQKLAFDANMVKLTGNGSPYMLKAHDRYAEIAEAIKTLKELPYDMLQTRMPL